MNIQDLPKLVDRPEYQAALKDSPEAAAVVAKQFAAEVLPQAQKVHVEAVKAIRASLVALCEANQAEKDVRRAAAELGYPMEYLPDMAIPWLGTVNDRGASNAFFYLSSTFQYSDD